MKILMQKPKGIVLLDIHHKRKTTERMTPRKTSLRHIEMLNIWRVNSVIKSTKTMFQKS